MTTKYIRVILAYEEEDEALLHVALENFIEADECGAPFTGVTGAYVSAPYDDRNSALEAHPFINRPDMTPEQQAAFDEAALNYEAAMMEYYQEQ